MNRSTQAGWRRQAAAALSFLLFFLLFDRLLFLGLREWAFRFYGGRFDEAAAQERGRAYEKYQGLVFGSSRAQQALDARAIGRSLGLRLRSKAGGGRFPASNLLFFRRQQAHLDRLRLVVYGVDYFMFAHRSSPAKMARLRRAGRREVLDPGGSALPAGALSPRLSLLLAAKPGIDGFVGDLARRRRRGETDGDDEAESAAGRPALTPRPAGAFRRRDYRRFPGEEGREFARLLAELSRRRVLVFLVFLPDHAGTNATNHEQRAFKADIERLARRFPGAHCLDFNTPQRFDLLDAGLFQDGGWGRSNCHLSERGRRLLSERVAAELRRFLAAP